MDFSGKFLYMSSGEAGVPHVSKNFLTLSELIAN